MTFDEAAAFALTLPGAELSTHFRQPAVKANGRAFLNAGHEAGTSFVLALDADLIAMLIETRPETFWQSPHYAGTAAVLARYDGPDPALVRAMIERAHGRAVTLGPPRPRKPR